MVSQLNKKILFVTHASNAGGAEAVLVDMITACGTMYDTFLFAPRGHYPALLQHPALKKRYTVWLANGAVDISWSLLNWLLLPFGMVKNVFRLIRIIKQQQINLVITNTSTICYAALAARWCGIKHILVIHEQIPYPMIRRWWFALNERYSQAIICLTQTIQQQYHQSNKTVVIPLGIAAKKLQQLQQIKKLPSSTLRVSLVGKVYPTKGADRFVDLALAIMETHPGLPVQFTSYGAVCDQTFFRSLQVRAQAKVQFKSHQPIEQILANTDLVVITSRSEVAPLILLEAMAAAIPVVTFAVGNARSVVVDGVTGYVVPTGDMPRLQSAVLKLLLEPDKISQFGRNAQQHVIQHHQSHFTEQLLRLIQTTFNS